MVLTADVVVSSARVVEWLAVVVSLVVVVASVDV